MRGRKPKPDALHALHGSTEPRRPDSPKPVGDLSDAPTHFSFAQIDTWNYALANAPPGMLKRVDRAALEAWVVACDLHRQAVVAQAKTNLIIATPSGVPIQSPYLAIINRQVLIMLKAGSELGFTPVSRPRIAGGAGLTPEPPQHGSHAEVPRQDIESYLASAPRPKALH